MANHMTQWKPEASYDVFGQNKRHTIRFRTYQELQKEMKIMLGESKFNEVCVSRSRRGAWGEWYEKWQMRDGKPYKFSETWL
jgi:hypothetical protein